MTSIVSYLLEPQTAIVFDIDGVLAAYEFGDLCHAAFPDGDWEAYVREHDPYATARPIALIQRLVERKGPELSFACSVAAPYEEAGKRGFVCRNYGIPADHVRMVREKADKVAFLEEVAAGLDLPQRRVAIVDDTVKTLDAIATSSEFVTVHVSSLFALGE